MLFNFKSMVRWKQITKYFASIHKASLYPPVQIFSWFNLVYVENKGISFGILSKFNISFYLGLVSFFVSFYIIYLLKKSKKVMEKIALSSMFLLKMHASSVVRPLIAALAAQWFQRTKE